MRLDHLLSKERLAVGGGGQRPAVRVCRVGVLVGGDTGELDLVRSGGVSTAWWCCGAGGWESVAGVWLVMVVGTLLGPEGTTGGSGPCGGRCPGGGGAPSGGDASWVGGDASGVVVSVPGMAWSAYRSGALPCWWCGPGLGVGGGVVGWLLVENCTVDASILFSVVKLSRAAGGCLGTRSR